MKLLSFVALVPALVAAHSHHNLLRALSVPVPGPDNNQTQFAPLPDTSSGVPIDPAVGYYVKHLGGGTYWVTEGTYQSMFVVTKTSVIVVDAPPTIGTRLLTAIGNVTKLPVKHIVYSHAHADHIGAAFLFNTTRPEIVAHAETLRLLKEIDPDPLRPLPTKTFEKKYDLRVGNQTLELSYRGVAHSPGNIFIRFPVAKTLMHVDTVFPGWVPFAEVGVAADVPGWVASHDWILSYPWDILVTGHLARTATRQDVITQREYAHDLLTNCRASINFGFDVEAAIGPTRDANPGNSWAVFKAYLRAAADDCAQKTAAKWIGVLGGADVFTWENAYKVMESVRIDYGVLGPFGVQ